MGLVSLVTLLPLVGGLVVFTLSHETAKRAALGISLLVLALSLPLWFQYVPLSTAADPAAWKAMQLTEGPFPWIADLGISYHVGLDGIALPLVLLTTVLTPLVIYSSWSSISERANLYMGFMLMLETGMLGAFVSLDTFLFYIFWELMLIPMYFIIGMWGGNNRIYATIKFFVYTLLGSLLMLVALLALYYFHHEQLGTWTTSLEELAKVDLPFRTQLWLFSAFALAFAVKVPMFPVHTWLPDAHVQAPTGGSVILAGVLLKMGTFGFLRYALPLFPEAAVAAAPLLLGLAVVGIIYGALVAMVQDDVKKLVAYSSVSHMGVVMVGIFAFNVEGTSGAVYQMLNHGVSTGALFLLVGVLYERRHTREISEYGGLASAIPLFSVVFLITTLSSIGLPGLNGFVGEILVLLGSFQHHPVITAFAATGMILGAVYMLRVYQRMVFGPLKNAANAGLSDLTGREIAYLAPLLVLMFAMGLFPQPILDRINPTVERVLQDSVLTVGDLGEARFFASAEEE